MNEVELKSCPFCGGKAELLTYDWGYSVREYWVYCGCGCELKKKHSKEEAIEDWNTRKPMEQIVEYLKEQCERENERFKDTVGTEIGERHFGWLSGLDEALHKVKEVGG